LIGTSTWISLSNVRINTYYLAFEDNRTTLVPEGDLKRYEFAMKKWGEENQKLSDKIVVTYPDIRTITGEYLMREVTFK